MSDTEEKRGRGRPSLGDARPMMIRLPAEMIDDIDHALGDREKRADLIRSAIERELERRLG